MPTIGGIFHIYMGFFMFIDKFPDEIYKTELARKLTGVDRDR